MFRESPILWGKCIGLQIPKFILSRIVKRIEYIKSRLILQHIVLGFK